VGDVLTPPPDYELSLADLPKWLASNIATSRKRAKKRLVVLNLDGREFTFPEPTTTQTAMVNFNSFLRRQPDTLALWPVVNKSFALEASAKLADAGGGSALASSPVLEVQGLAKSAYVAALDLILKITGVRLDDAAISLEEAQSCVDPAESIGKFLETIHGLIASRYDIGDLGQQLPRLTIIVTSNGDTTTSCRMLQRGDQFFVDPDRLLQFSRANVADDWRRRTSDNPRRGLPFITSLFEVRLAVLTSSSVVNACAFCPTDADLPALVRKHYPRPVRSNAANSMRNSPLVRLLSGQREAGMSFQKASAQISRAYTAIQERTGEKHRQINQSIVSVLTDALEIRMEGLQFEHHPIAGGELRVDVWFQRGERPEAIEFTHRRDDDISAAALSSYMLTKIQDYARDFRLI
jgi:hypothetical protein